MTAPTLVDFLRAQLDADQAAARRARSSLLRGAAGLNDGDDGWGAYVTAGPGFPDHVLSDVAAKRRLVDEYEAAAARVHDDEQMPEGPEWILGRRHGLWLALLALASGYADRPGYRSEWAL